ncbi:hypothetical protein J6497_15745 [Bradyrhizobium sp. CNPSo 4026]|nr:hypothetical protein [Bradyrhizobium cenepequi]
MRAGDFERAWAISDHDLAYLCRMGPAKHTGPRHLQRIWRGEPLRDKRVLVRCYHGLGDTIQFVRFMPALRAVAREVTLWCQAELLPLLARAEGVDRAMPLHDGTPDAGFDVDIEIMEVPHAIRAGNDLVAMRRPYLTLPGDDGRAAWRIGDGLAVGLVWEVGDWDKRRVIPAALMRRLNGDGVRLYSLQQGPAAAQAPGIGAADISTPDIGMLGRTIKQLDLVVCVDTMIAHLAGALGCEAWVLLHSDCDWRWPASGDTTFWYPSLRLFHQPSPGDWSSLLEEVRLALVERARTKGRNMRSPTDHRA